MWAGCAWATGALAGPSADETDEVLQDAEKFGLPLSAEDLEPQASGGVWRQNLPALEAFLAMTTQWNCVGLATGGVRVIGLNYTAAPAAFELAGIDVTPETWADVQIIECGAREAMNGTGT